MIRPATPLSVLLLAAFGLLLISVLSVPIITAIPLGNFRGVTYGVFGLCTSTGCSGIEVGYDAAAPFASEPQDFEIPANTRNNLTRLLIVHPIAAALTLVMFILALVSHLHSASHSARYLLLMFIVSIFDFLICLLAFLVDVLVFVPHMAWGSYVVLAATIMVAFSGLVSCAMRRTVVNRKARKKRIAENAEMSGENYYNREAAVKPAPVPTQPTLPMVSGALSGSNQDSLPTFATFENQKKDDQVSDERIPLTSRSPSDRSPNNMPADMATDPMYGQRRSGSAPPLQRDQYGNVINDPAAAYGVRRGPSLESVRGRGGGPPPGGYRGRGGYGPPGRGGAYGGYGPPPNGRGGYGQGGRGGYGPPPNGRGGYGPPPRGGYGPGGMRGGRAPPPGYAGPYDRRTSGDSYNGGYGPRPSDPYSSNQSIPNSTGYEAYNPDRVSLPRAESPPPLPDEQAAPVGQAVEMDASTGSPQHPPKGFGQFGQLRDSDADIAGMVGLQQGRTSTPQRHDTYMSDGSRYSNQDQYVPPRQAWSRQGSNSPRLPSPLNAEGRPVELPARGTPPVTGSTGPSGTATSGTYYEDVDPRFADTAPRSAVPPPLQISKSFEDIHNSGGAASPGAESDKSNFTSISQRGVNPRWNPPPPPMPMSGGYGQPAPRRPPRQRDDMLLNSNPDFQLPGNRTAGSRAQGPGMIPGSAYPNNL